MSTLVISLFCSEHTQASQRVDPINVHGTTPTDALPTTPPECQGWIHLILDSYQRIQHHRSRLVQVQCVGLHFGFLARGIRRPAIDVESLCSGLCRLSGFVDGGGFFGGDGLLGGRHGFTDVGEGLDGCISAAEERGEGRRTSRGQEAGCCGAESGHCGEGVVRVELSI